MSHRRGVAHAGHVFQAEDALVAEPLDLPEEEGIVDFALEQLVAAGHAGAVEVADHVQVPLDVLQQIALHDLHVVAIEEQLQPIGAELAADGRAAVAAGRANSRDDRRGCSAAPAEA